MDNDQRFTPKNENFETGETSGTNKGKKRQRTYNNFFEQTIRNNSTPFGNKSLNIDCSQNRKELIDKWAQEISLIIQTNDFYDDPKTVLLLVEHKTTGRANSLVKSTKWDLTVTPVKAFEQVLDVFYTMFLGIDFFNNKLQESLKTISKAKTTLTNMQLCDICYLEQLHCDYEKNLYLLTDEDDYKKYVKDYLLKIPFIGQKALDRFLVEASQASLFSLGFAQRIVKEEISKICDLTKKQKKLKSFSKSCCEKIVEQSYDYGCRTKKKKKRHKKEISNYRFRKKEKTFQIWKIR